MTLVSFDTRIARHRSRPSASADRFRLLKAAIDDFMRWRVRRQEQKALDALPLDLRKDLGWPSTDGRPSGRG